MTAELSNNCSTITIESNFFNANNISNQLTLVHSGTTYTVEVDAENVDPVVVDANTLDLEELPEGVYLITLKTTDEDSTVTTEQLCLTSMCALHCDMITLYTDTTNLEKILAYEALKVASDCITCSCTVMQRLYDNVTDTSNATKCNCQSA